jgi:hypothetical protein
MSKDSKSTIPLIISKVLVILLCVIIYSGFKNPEAPLGQLVGVFNILVLFPLVHFVVAIIFRVAKMKSAIKVHFIVVESLCSSWL